MTEIRWTREIVWRAPATSVTNAQISQAEVDITRAMDDGFRRLFRAPPVDAPKVETPPLTEASLLALMRSVFKPAYRVSEHVPPDAMYQIQPQSMIYGHRPEKLIIVGKRAARAIDWETYGKKRWTGRNWRRIKRERRKFVMEGRR